MRFCVSSFTSLVCLLIFFFDRPFFVVTKNTQFLLVLVLQVVLSFLWVTIIICRKISVRILNLYYKALCTMYVKDLLQIYFLVIHGALFFFLICFIYRRYTHVIWSYKGSKKYYSICSDIVSSILFVYSYIMTFIFNHLHKHIICPSVRPSMLRQDFGNIN